MGKKPVFARFVLLLPLFYSLLFSCFHGIICTREFIGSSETEEHEKAEKQEAQQVDFSLIKVIAGEDVAKKLCDNDYFDNHIGRAAGDDVDGEQLDNLIKGAFVLGAQPVDYPLTDGVYLYLRLRTGDVIALFIETDVKDQDGGSYEVLRISRTDIK